MRQKLRKLLVIQELLFSLFELFLESKKTSNYGIAALLFVALFLTQYLFSRLGGIVSRSDDNAQYEQRDLRRRLLSLYVIAN